jgi:hypothetical protein
MYTVFTEDGKPKYHLGLVVFVRTLSAAREHCEPGDTITGWSNSGYARTIWECGPDGKVRVVPKAR